MNFYRNKEKLEKLQKKIEEQFNRQSRAEEKFVEFHNLLHDIGLKLFNLCEKFDVCILFKSTSNKNYFDIYKSIF